MDISDLLAFKPETIPKRKQDGDEENDGKQLPASAQMTKKPKFDPKILELIETGDEDDSDVLDEVGLKKLALLFEKRVLNNQKMRLKYPDDPQKFMVRFAWSSCLIVAKYNFMIIFRNQRWIFMMRLNNSKLSQPSQTFIL